VASICVILAAWAAALGFVTSNEVRVDNGFDRAHLSLVATGRHLDLVRADLATVRVDLGAVDGQVGVDAATLSQDRTQLQGVERALAGARTAVSKQTSTMADLRVCLAGVEQALNALSVGDHAHAISALDAVATSCSHAVAANG
jgi:hypothetical protein